MPNCGLCEFCLKSNGHLRGKTDTSRTTITNNINLVQTERPDERDHVSCDILQ